MEFIKSGERDGLLLLRSETGETAAFEFLDMAVVNGREYAALLQQGEAEITVLRLLEDGARERYAVTADDEEFAAAVQAFARSLEEED